MDNNYCWIFFFLSSTVVLEDICLSNLGVNHCLFFIWNMRFSSFDITWNYLNRCFINTVHVFVMLKLNCTTIFYQRLFKMLKLIKQCLYLYLLGINLRAYLFLNNNEYFRLHNCLETTFSSRFHINLWFKHWVFSNRLDFPGNVFYLTTKEKDNWWKL